MRLLTEPQRDALCELTNVGAGHGASALSRLLDGARLGFQPPESREASVADLAALLGGERAPRVAAIVEVQGDAAGALWLVLAPDDAEMLAARLTGAPRPDAAATDAALGDAARALASAALSAMGQLTGLSLSGGLPHIRRDDALPLAAAACSGGGSVPVFDAQLHGPGFAAQLLFLPDGATLGVLLRSLRV